MATENYAQCVESQRLKGTPEKMAKMICLKMVRKGSKKKTRAQRS